MYLVGRIQILAVLTLVMIMGFISTSHALPVLECLAAAHTAKHRLQKEQDIENCFQYSKNSILPSQCFNYVDRALKMVKTIDLNETLNTICVYEVAQFKNVNECVSKAKRFELADNKDEVIFECYRQFQNEIDQTQCLDLAKKMIYPGKKDYMIRQCNNK